MTVEELSERIIHGDILNDHTGFVIKEDRYVGLSDHSNDPNDILEHYGVKGMKWGVRKEYVPHPRKKAKYNSEEVVWVKEGESSKTSKKTKTKKKRTPINKQKLLKTALAVGAVATISYMAYSETQRYRTTGRTRVRDVIDAMKGKVIDVDFTPVEPSIKWSPEKFKVDVADTVPKVETRKKPFPSADFKEISDGAFQANTYTAQKRLIQDWMDSKKDAIQFKDGAGSIKYHTKNTFDKNLWESLSSSEQEAVKGYTGDWFSSMNKILRGQTKLTDYNPSTQDTITKYIADCRSALSKSITKQDIISHRGVPLSSISKMLNVDPSVLNSPSTIAGLTGIRFSDEGFFSSAGSTHKAWASGSSGVAIHTFVPKGSQAMYVDPISEHKGEDELLIQQGTKYVIEQVITNSEGKLTDLMISVIQQIDPDKKS